MRKFGLIGKSLSHSFSPGYFKNKFELEGIKNASYENFELANIEEVKTLFENEIVGFNVTIPYKLEVMDYLVEVDAAAIEIGAVNCIKKTGIGYKGYNTDWLGFKNSLLPFIENNLDLKALVLGYGGASKAVCYALDQIGIKYKIISRKSGYTDYDALTKEMIEMHTLIINTTSLGMYPQINDKPALPYDLIGAQHYLYDLIYNPEVTLFLQEGLNKKAKIKNGYAMLIGQAEESWRIWNEG